MRNIVRQRILKKYDFQCHYCKSTKDLEVYHIIPLSKGGKEDEDNMQILCKKCNRSKSNKLDIDQFIIIVGNHIVVKKEFIELNLTPLEFQKIINQKFKEI